MTIPAMLRAALLLLLALPTQAHEGCFAPTPQLAILRIAQNAQFARLAKQDEERYWAAALTMTGLQEALQAAQQEERERGQRHCEAFVAPHAGAPLEAAFQWQCEADWSRRVAHRVWSHYLRGRPAAPPEPPLPADTE